jgi:GcrA cell cycle regulator
MDPWPDEMIERLKVMRSQGLTSQVIADALGVTRNAVIGKANRLGLSEPRKPKGSNRVVQPPPPAAVPREPPPAPREDPPLLDEAPRMERVVPLVATGHDTALRLVDLQVGQCRWICNDPRDEGGALFCGHRAIPGKSWCRAHHAVVYQPWHARRVA